jgi:hypothetical protein
VEPLFSVAVRSVPKCDTHSDIQGIAPVQFDVVGNVVMAVVARPPLFWSAVCFSYIQQQGKRVYNKVKASAIAQIRAIAK